MTPRHLADLDELILSCRDQKSKELVQEAHICYRAGAYRSCIIATWVAVTYDLTEKVRELASLGDINAISEMAKLDGAIVANNIAYLKKYEGVLMDLCDATLGFFHPTERQVLDRIYQDRNRSAHPSHIRPGEPFEVSAELARLHLRSAIEIVLTQPATTGKAALAALEQMVSGISIPATRGAIRKVFEIGPLAKPKASLFDEFIRRMVKNIVEPGLKKPEKRKRIEIIGAAFDMHPSLALDLSKNSLRKMLSKAKDSELMWVIAIVANVKPIADEIEEGLAICLETFIENAEDHEVVTIASDALRLERFAEKARSRIAKMDTSDLAAVVNSIDGVLDYSVLDRGIDLLEAASKMSMYSWPHASSVIDSILHRGAKAFSFTQLERLFEIVDNRPSRITPASGFNDLIEALRENSAMANGVFEREMQRRDWGKSFLPKTPPEEDF